jgi:hypothetical protein
MDYENGIGHSEYPPDSIEWGNRYDIKLSMYFEFSQAQNHVRTLTQGVSLSDSKSVNRSVRRVLVSGAAAFQGAANGVLLLIRRSADSAAALPALSRSGSFNRFVYDTARSASDVIRGSLGVIRHIADSAAALPALSRSVSFNRFVYDTARSASDAIRGSLGVIREITETAAARCSLSRRLDIAVKIVTFAAVRDFIARRFLLAGARLDIKSKITREIVIDSRIRN